MTMTPPDRPRRSVRVRPGSSRPGASRPKQAPRPDHPSSSSLSSPSPLSAGTTDIHLSPATFVDLSADQERHAIEALAELLVPLLTDPHRTLANPNTEPIVATVVAIGDP